MDLKIVTLIKPEDNFQIKFVQKFLGVMNMTKEKIFDADKQENQLQDQFADELLSEKELDSVAGGTGEETIVPDFIIRSTHHLDDYHCH